MAANHTLPTMRDIESLLYEDVQVNPSNAPHFILGEEQIDIWAEPYAQYHSRTPVDYVRNRILEMEKKGQDPFPDIVGKTKEKELVKTALFSGSPILFRGEKGYGKTTFSKSIAKLLPEKLIAVKGCKIYDDPIHPSCFSCKHKVLNQEAIEVTWVPTVWVRIPGDPMLTTRQLVGGISIQKIREGYDLDHPEVFIPGRAIKANRGVGYFDELGALPTSLQTLLHELFEEHQVTTTEGDIVPFKISTLELASTNPANYRGTSPIKEPLLDRMEAIDIGPPETLSEEVEIGLRNMYVVKALKKDPKFPVWHAKILARVIRFARDEAESSTAKKVQSHPSCRGTIKLFDHVKSRALRSGREVPLIADYGEQFEMVELALGGRLEIEYGVKQTKREIIQELLTEAVRVTCKEYYDRMPPATFEAFYKEIMSKAQRFDGEAYLPISKETADNLQGSSMIVGVLGEVFDGKIDDKETFLSALEMALHSVSLCLTKYAEKRGPGYILREMTASEA
ncbi:MAG: ATPase [Thaumarchaeota archaeon]|nr:ATPase [Nitrososphaerota archaeon]